MASTKEFTYSDVAEHNTKNDLYMVVHDKVYNASSFVDEHPYVAPSPPAAALQWKFLLPPSCAYTGRQPSLLNTDT